MEIQPYTIDKGKFRFLNLKEFWAYRELLLMLSYRDFKIRYAQTFIGVLWSFIQPFLTLLIFVVIFQKALKVDTGSVPYSVFALSGIVAWSYFDFVLSQAGSSIIGSQSLVTKIYFPRLIIPLSKSILGLIDMSISLVFLIVLLLFIGFKPPVHSLVFFPLFLLMLFVFSSGVGILLSALTIRFRDLQYVVPFLVKIGLYATPVAYPISLFPKKYYWLCQLNPMTGIITGFRWCFTGQDMPSNNLILYSAVFSVVLLFVATYVFSKVEDIIADIV